MNVVSPQNDLPVDHLARQVVRSALLASMLNAAVFTGFAYITTQVKPVRHVSPWQDDPYDTVVTFTMFFVPIISALIVSRMVLCRRTGPVPVHRLAQLRRASLVTALLVTGTYLTDWAAVTNQADQSLWTSHTPWLISALAAVSVGTAVTGIWLVRTWWFLPHPPGDQAPSDWLDDTRLLIDLAAARLPRPAGRFTPWLDRHDAVGWVRRRATLLVAAGSVLAGLLVATALARENGVSVLFFDEAAWFAGGMYAFGMITNSVLRLTVPQPRGRLRQALHTGVIAGAAALPISLGLRETIMAAVGMSGLRHTIGSITALTFTCALLSGVVAFAGTMTWSHRG
jgi:hypothetical protein